MVIPRLLSVVYWMIAGFFLYRLAKEIVSSDGAIVATLIFLFLPYGVRASRSFQPDPLMIMLFIISIYCVYGYYTNPSARKLAIVSVVSALAILVKPVCLFPILGAFFAMRIPARNFRAILLKPDLYIFGFTSLIPTLIYYGYGIYLAGFLKPQSDSSFLPMLISDPFYWKSWYRLMMNVTGRWLVIFSIVGLFFIRQRDDTAFMLGLWAGYFVFGLVFTYHIHTHDYYHLMLIPISALSLSFVASRLLNDLDIRNILWRIAFWCLLIYAVSISVRESVAWLGDKGYADRIKRYEEIGKVVNHSMSSLILDSDYGNGLMFHGRVACPDGAQWPTGGEPKTSEEKASGKNISDHLEERISKISAEYFIISDPTLLEKHTGLNEVLNARYRIVAESPDYIIYDLRNKKNAN